MRGPCAGCAAGDHHLCWIAYCYGCKDPYHGRKPGGVGPHKTSISSPPPPLGRFKLRTLGNLADTQADYDKSYGKSEEWSSQPR